MYAIIVGPDKHLLVYYSLDEKGLSLNHLFGEIIFGEGIVTLGKLTLKFYYQLLS